MNELRIQTIAVCACLMATGIVSAEDAGPRLGSPDWRPSRDQPCGWRGDGTGRFPGATNPPVKWDVAGGEHVRWRTAINTARPSKRDQAMGWQFVAGDPVCVMGGEATIARLDGTNCEVVASFKSGFVDKPNHHGHGPFNSPVLEGNRMYFRDLKVLYCIEKTMK
jgi:hypothetical protein